MIGKRERLREREKVAENKDGEEETEQGEDPLKGKASRKPELS